MKQKIMKQQGISLKKTNSSNKPSENLAKKEEEIQTTLAMKKDMTQMLKVFKNTFGTPLPINLKTGKMHKFLEQCSSNFSTYPYHLEGFKNTDY